MIVLLVLTISARRNLRTSEAIVTNEVNVKNNCPVDTMRMFVFMYTVIKAKKYRNFMWVHTILWRSFIF
jgi:hypothetical protein